MADTGVARPNGPGWAQEGWGEGDRQSIATAEGADAYREHFTRTVLPELQRIDGYQGTYLLRRDHDIHVRLKVLTLWDALEAIRTFAGANLENAVVEPAAQAALVGYDSTVTHHIVVDDAIGANSRAGE